MSSTVFQPSFSSESDHIKLRCLSLQNLILNSLPPSKLSPQSKLSLLRLLQSEILFLLRLPPLPISSNIGYLESITLLLLHPSLRNASRLSDPIANIICTFNSSPAWFLVSHRNPARISWTGTLRSRSERALLAARSAPISLKPSSLFLVFARGLPDDAALEIGRHLGAVEFDARAECRAGSWGMKGSRWFRVGIVEDDVEEVGEVVVCGNEGDFGKDEFGEFLSCLRPMKDGKVDLVNFDTTALVAIVSGISNGAAESLIRAPEDEMRLRFKGNYKFVIAQATSELEQSILKEFRVVLKGKKGIICESVLSEFKELVFMCGGANEKLRAVQLLKHLLVVPDRPSARISDLSTTRRIAEKNKVIFGTGDRHHAPTLTANTGFVRAISQTGVSLLTIEHKPRALTGD